MHRGRPTGRRRCAAHILRACSRRQVSGGSPGPRRKSRSSRRLASTTTSGPASSRPSSTSRCTRPRCRARSPASRTTLRTGRRLSESSSGSSSGTRIRGGATSSWRRTCSATRCGPAWACSRALVQFLRDEGVGDLTALRAWAERSDFRRDFQGRVQYTAEGRTFGLGPAVYSWLVMRLGIETLKPDERLHRFVETAIGHRASDSDVASAIAAAAAGLGVSPLQLHWSICQEMRE